MSGLKIEIDGTEYLIPEDLDLNDVVAVEEQGWSLESMSSMDAFRFMVWRLLRRTDPEITLEEAGAKVPISTFIAEADAEEEGPPPIPLSEPEALSGTSGGGGRGNGSTGTDVKAATHVASGLR